MRTIRRPRFQLIVSTVVVSLMLTACAGTSWRSARSADNLADYRRFIRKYPDSSYRVRADEHIRFLELERELTLDGYASFKLDYPDSTLADSLRDQIEPKAFDRARFAGTPAAYTDFIALYPEGPYTARAQGNRVFLESGGFGSGVTELDEFAKSHPTSDYAAEALKSVQALALKTRERFKRVGLTIRISPETPEVSRLVSAFTDRARRKFKSAGYQLVDVPELQTQAESAKNPKARLVIEHKEAPTKAKLDKGNFSRPGMLATTRVSLYAKTGSKPIWQRVFRQRIDSQQHFAGTSVLFNTNARPYWQRFFVPVASWPNRAVLRNPVTAEKQIVAVDSAGDRTAILYDNGEFQLLEMADSEAAFPLAKYSRPKDFTRWKGIKILGKRVVIYGDDGVEVVGFHKSGPRKLGAQERQAVGAISAVIAYDDDLILASSRGLLTIDASGGNPRRLLRRPVKGLDRINDSLVFTDGESVFVSNLALLGNQRVEKKVELGYEFGPYRVVGFGDSAAVLGKGGVVVIDLSNPKQPKIVSRLSTKKIGRVEDLVAVSGRLFLLGERGLQMLDAKARRVVETVDVQPRQRAARMGRFIVTVGKQGLQVVDSAPLTSVVGTVSRQGAAAPSQ